MLYHPYILSLGMVLFLIGTAAGYKRAKSPSPGERSLHRYLVYPAYFMFILAMALYYGHERNLALDLAGGRQAFAATGLLPLHTVSIASASILLTITVSYGFILRNRFFAEKISGREILHMALGSLGVAFYTLAVVSGIAMYVKTGVL